MTTQKDDKKVITSGGHRARFDVTMLTNTAILDPLTKTARSPKVDKNDACGIAQNLTSMYCLSTYVPEKMPFNALVFTLRSIVELNLKRAIRHVIAQSVQFSKIAKKLNIDLCQFFSSPKGSTVFIKIMK